MGGLASAGDSALWTMKDKKEKNAENGNNQH